MATIPVQYLDLLQQKWSRPGEVRVIFEITPHAAQGMS